MAYSVMRAAELAALLRAPKLAGEPTPKFVVIDVRDHDFQGGNIAGCVNVPSATISKAIDELVEQYGQHDMVIFHCMYSQQRGPSCAKYFARNLDARKHLAQVYCLEGGFRSWAQQFGRDSSLTANFDPDAAFD
ncbi:hypothetical protein CAOG_00718 [Capsaspora owczarzaki ATCC 30864]|uniref:Rhodanese domain-containing protein n=1 Tax=Capsaspora owczarzaki (strain ATCC 30864) TaxID=595528 RepID=A0A0D2WJ23_CAPO3|nr:hypothetical protein CAOG_00718 [Capsaspora owczarzaki ATCC 30864]KJE89198.1 hypothetical protein CAOG_000718 [Capsaspora owczarzaki ATCC 30864]|eukprot:XP_004365589.2 hypothetical protein CAOG_00718 [Capsaspora owczarzaki ATCC 30864]